MSASGREVAHRVFAAEYDDATHSYSESDEERAPNYVVTPTGARVNRVFFVGVLTAVESVSEDVLRARVADPTGVFVVYAGQYQPDEMGFLEAADPPAFVAVTGKARTFSPDDSDRVFTSVRPESINEVDAEARDRWTVEAAESTMARVATAAAAMDLDAAGDALSAALRESGVPADLADGIPRAFDVYGTTEQYLGAVGDLAADALRLVADEADEVPGLEAAPDAQGEGTVDVGELAALDDAIVDIEVPDGAAGAAETEPATDAAAAAGDEPTAQPEADEQAESEEAAAPDEEPEPEEEAEADEEPEPDEGAEADEEPEPDEEADQAPEAAAGDEPSPEEPEAEPAADPAEGESVGETAPTGDGELGDFEPAGGEEGAADEMPAEDVLDDDERERLEEEYGTFESGTEVSEPGEADIEPEAGQIDAGEVPGEAEPDAEADTAGEQEAAASAREEEAAADEGDAGEGAGEAVDLEAAVMEWMTDLDDGDGADREALVAAVVDEHGVDPGAVEDAIQDALMAGKCYEPDDAHVKPI